MLNLSKSLSSVSCLLLILCSYIFFPILNLYFNIFLVLFLLYINFYGLSTESISYFSTYIFTIFFLVHANFLHHLSYFLLTCSQPLSCPLPALSEYVSFLTLSPYVSCYSAILIWKAVRKLVSTAFLCIYRQLLNLLSFHVFLYSILQLSFYFSTLLFFNLSLLYSIISVN